MRKARGPYTRYFRFSRHGSTKGDADVLVDQCILIDAAVGFKTHRVDGGVCLSGIIVLRGPRTYIGDLQACFPLFKLSILDTDADLDSGLMFANGDLPFEEVRKSLFGFGAPRREMYRSTLDRMGAPGDWNGTIDDWMFFEDKTKSQQKKIESWSIVVNCD